VNSGTVLRAAEREIALVAREEAHLEAEVLLMHVLQTDRVGLYTQLEKEISAIQAEKYHQLVQRRLLHEPLSYIIGHREFFDFDFYVDNRVLIPRPETELVVQTCLDYLKEPFIDCGETCYIADIGTGSGAIAISLALSYHRAVVYASDISIDALEVAIKNCHRHGVRSRVYCSPGDMLEPLTQPVNLIVANLPYISDADFAELSPEINVYEPAVALAGGVDGLDCMRRLLLQIRGKLRAGGAVVLEVGEGQAHSVVALAREQFSHARIDIINDYAAIERVVKIMP